jgi:hypothetical protein
LSGADFLGYGAPELLVVEATREDEGERESSERWRADDRGADNIHAGAIMAGQTANVGEDVVTEAYVSFPEDGGNAVVDEEGEASCDMLVFCLFVCFFFFVGGLIL